MVVAVLVTNLERVESVIVVGALQWCHGGGYGFVVGSGGNVGGCCGGGDGVIVVVVVVEVVVGYCWWRRVGGRGGESV